MSTDRLLTAEELSKAINLHPRGIYRLAKTGQLPCVRIGGSVRFHLPTIIAANSQAAPGKPAAKGCK